MVVLFAASDYDAIALKSLGHSPFNAIARIRCKYKTVLFEI